MVNSSENPLVLDLFCGAGGLSLGFERAGFSVACAIDNHPDPVLTYENNRIKLKNKTKLLSEDISKLKGKNIINATSEVIKKPFKIDVIIGGPPCQGFSLRGKRKKNDPRNKLVFDFFRIVDEINPEVFVFENVVGISTKNNREFLKSVFEKIKKINYNFSLDILDSTDYGVPQERKRLIIIGNKSGETIYLPKKSKEGLNEHIFEDYDISKPKYDLIPIVNNKVTAKEALDDIAYPIVRNNPCSYKKKASSVYQKSMHPEKSKIYNHITTKHREKTKKVLSLFEQGQTMLEIPKNYQTKRLSIYRMRENKPSRTITSCNEDFIHYSLNRIITIREMARLQSYPDNYVFYGTPTTGGDRRKYSCCQVQQVGNSVPPFLAQAVAEGVLKILSIKSNNLLKNFITKLNSRRSFE